MGKDRLAAFSDGVIVIHHDYGAGVKGAARLGLGGVNGSDSKFRQLCFELYLFGDLLEQSPPPFCTPLRAWTGSSSGPTPSSCFGSR